VPLETNAGKLSLPEKTTATSLKTKATEKKKTTPQAMPNSLVLRNPFQNPQLEVEARRLAVPTSWNYHY